MNRRSFLFFSLGTISTQLFAAAGSPRFLLVFLRGGYDAANLLVPYTSDFYYEVRPTIAVPREAALKLDSGWALHPAAWLTLAMDSLHESWRYPNDVGLGALHHGDEQRDELHRGGELQLGQLAKLR